MSNSDRQFGWFAESHIPPDILDSTIFRFQINLPDGRTIQVDLTKDIDIDYDNLEDQMSDLPAMFTFWSCIYSELKYVVITTERRIRARRGVLYDEATTQARIHSVKLTETQIKVIADADETLNSLEAELAMFQKHTGKLYFMVEALKMKSELVRSLAGFKRQDKDMQR